MGNLNKNIFIDAREEAQATCKVLDSRRGMPYHLLRAGQGPHVSVRVGRTARRGYACPDHRSFFAAKIASR